MNLRLADLSACFEGVIPSIIATAAADGTPNISYLSHVLRVDDDHVAISNQFFAKTAANVRANTQVTLILVDGTTGEQYLLDIGFQRSVESGALFERIAGQLKASSAQVGMSEVMRLRSADIFRVHAIEKVPSPVECRPAPRRDPVDLAALAEAVAGIEMQAAADGIIDSLLAGVRQVLGHEQALVLIRDGASGALVTTGSMGYARSGLGSEAPGGAGLIGEAAASGRAIKVSDMSRVRRFGEAITLEAEADASENATRSVAFPQLPSAMSQIAVPMMSRGVLTGVLFVESPERLAFREEDEAALRILAAQAATALRASEQEAAAAEPGRLRPRPLPAPGRQVRVLHHGYDDSVFVDGVYIVKGVAGMLLRMMLDWHLNEGRSEFTNRELRLAAGSRMPEIKDNLETRLLLLRRRLEEKQAPVRVLRVERGRLRLDIDGALSLESGPE
ncbi:GAF domain-containing protein [Salipiger sp. H15]|uniref:GAF domain-containing protein n=1 Tax=Alloyangia sp. H15 TaxID=3029062 RepID=A0AAU8ALU4_9RHOB